MNGLKRTLLATAAAASFAAWAGTATAGTPSFVNGEVICTDYDGVTNDLLSAGLGIDGLKAGPTPTISSPPTAEELRRLAIFSNYRALVPFDPGGGLGTLFGPNIDADGNDTGTQGLIAGRECLAYDGDESGKINVTMMVQVPSTFDPAEACIVTATSSGSRGVYGAIGTAGEWGLKNGCAVAYSDKGSGNGAHNLSTNSVNLIQGERVKAFEAGNLAAFKARMSPEKRAEFTADYPNRIAYKHAHSRQNPEADWGKNVLHSIRFAFSVLNNMCKGNALTCEDKIAKNNTIVIASSVSNGGGSAVRAAERDKGGLIDGVAVSEPNVNPKPGGAFGIQQGAGAVLTDHSRSLLDYTTLVNVYQGCASAAASNAAAPFNDGGSANRCESLAEKGLLTGASLEERAAEAQQVLNDAGILPEQNITQPSHFRLYVSQAVGITYANAYGRFGVTKNLCGYSFGATDAGGDPTALSTAAEEALFGTGNGIPPTGGVNVINNESPGGAKLDQASISPSTNRADQNLDGALCVRGLATRIDPVSGEKLTGLDATYARRIKQGISEIRANGNLRGKPAVFVTGRNDAILAPNHTSRAYYGLNQLVEGGAGDLHYYEVLNAHHLDALTVLDVLTNTPLFSDKFIPLHHYLFQALDLMMDHLRNGTPLPPSQVVRTVPRGTTGDGLTLADVPPLDEATNLPPISSSPDAGDLITFAGGVLHIPD